MDEQKLSYTCPRCGSRNQGKIVDDTLRCKNCSRVIPDYVVRQAQAEARSKAREEAKELKPDDKKPAVPQDDHSHR